MGNTACVGPRVGLSDLCLAARDYPAFIPPNTDNVTLSFDYLLSPELKLLDGTVGVNSPFGFLIEPQKAPEGFQIEHQARLAPKWSTVHEYPPQLSRLIVSGRALVMIPEGQWMRSANCGPCCAFAVSTRGAMREQTIRTPNYSHTAQVVSSGVVFALFLAAMPSGIFLCPRVMLALESGEEVLLLDDRLGPVKAPMSFYCDFTVVDEGGRNVQLDIICRGVPQPAGKDAKEPAQNIGNMKTMLQDWTAVNNHVNPAYISFGNSSLATRLPNAAVYLQNLVISEEMFDEPVPGAEPYNAGQAVKNLRDVSPSKILFEGVDAQALAVKVGTPEAEALHPQIVHQKRRTSEADPSEDSFWYHILYDDDEADVTDVRGRGPYGSNRTAAITGEFWLSKAPVEKKNVYFSCSSTLAQALTTCIAFRFSCPPVHLSLISEGARGAKVLRHEHIPTNGIVMGLERHPSYRDLIHMFVEHRNQVMDDMTVCECHPSELTRTIVYQEIFDHGNAITYRLSLLRRDGSRQSAALQVVVDQLEESVFDSSRSGQETWADLSPRYPIVPCLLRHNLPPESRIFVYSSVAYKPSMEVDEPEEFHSSKDVQSELGTAGSMSLGRSPQDALSSPMVSVSDVNVEDWQSVGGGASDHELESSPFRAALGKGQAGEVALAPVQWRRPLVQSVTLLRRVEEAPIRCFPKSLAF